MYVVVDDGACRQYAIAFLLKPCSDLSDIKDPVNIGS